MLVVRTSDLVCPSSSKRYAFIIWAPAESSGTVTVADPERVRVLVTVCELFSSILPVAPKNWTISWALSPLNCVWKRITRGSTVFIWLSVLKVANCLIYLIVLYQGLY